MKKTGRTIRKHCLAALAVCMLGGCASASAKGTENSADSTEEFIENVANGEGVDVDGLIAMIAEGDYAKAVKEVNLARITAKTNQSLPEDTITLLDDLYSYCKFNQYLNDGDFVTAARWIEKVDTGILPEELKTKFDELCEKYKDQLG